MAYTRHDWDVVKAFYESGLSLSEITEREEVAIKDRSSISKKAKTEGWVKGKIQPLVEKTVHVKQQLAEISEQKSTLNSTELEVHQTLVDERTKDLHFFRKASLLIAQRAVKKVQETPIMDMKELEIAQNVIGKGKENIYGKSPDVAVQVNNQIGASQLREMTDDELLAIAIGRS